MRKVQLLVSVLLFLLLLVACAPQAVPAPAPAGQTQPAALVPAPAPAVSATLAKPAWQKEWEKTVEAAKTEGRVMLYSSLVGEQRQIVMKPFKSKYGISIESVTAGTSEIARKIVAEQQAGIYSADVLLVGSTSYRYFKEGTLDRLDMVLILPELTEPELIKKTWYFGEFSWANKARTMANSLMDLQENVGINTNLVKAGEITGYRDLLDPKWKGKISLQDPRVAGMASLWLAAVLELGDIDVNYMHKLLVEQEVFVTRDLRLQVDWLARGKHAVAIAPNTATVTQFIQLGAPIDRFNLGTPFFSGSTSGISIFKTPPHPNATKLFINWLLSQEGQTFHSQAVGVQSQRLDVPTAHLEPSKVLRPGLKLYNASNEEFTIKRAEIYDKLTKEIVEK